VEAHLGGKPFAGIRLDVVARIDEVAATEQLPLLGVLEFAGIPPRTMEVVDRRQHFAEKLHALTRDYGGRPNTRAKDLADLVLLIETGLTPDGKLHDVVRHVFGVRATHPVPDDLPDPPPRWREEYPALAGGLTETAPTLEAALLAVRTFWVRTTSHAAG
jgi:hypothetical protein